MTERQRIWHLVWCVALLMCGNCTRTANAADLFHLLDNNTDVPTISQYGGVGLLDTRTARFLPDRYLVGSVSIKNPDDRIAATFQALPWLEATFRWANNYAVRPALNPGQGADRSFDIKVRLWEESNRVPEIAFGLQDFLGTALYGGEYIVGSKQVGRFDISLGLGWGRLASRGTFKNPFAVLFSGFEDRPIAPGTGGNPTWDYFRGPDMGIFGGIEYQPRIHNLKFQLEYSSDAYRLEKLASGKDYGFPLNFGMSYRPRPGVELGLSFMHGREIGVRLSLFTDVGADHSAARIDPQPAFMPRTPSSVAEIERERAQASQASEPLVQRDQQGNAPPARDRPEEREQASTATLSGSAMEADSISKMRAAVLSQLLIVRGLEINGDRVRLAVENETYLRDSEAVSRVARALSATAPQHVEQFEIITTVHDIPVGDVVLERAEIDKLARMQGSPAELLRSGGIQSPPQSVPDLPAPAQTRFSWNIYPRVQQSIFDPDNPYYVSLGIGSSQSLDLGRGLWIGASESIVLYDTFNQIRRTSNSTLPHVRSDIAEYLRHGKYGIESLQSSYFFKLGSEIYGRGTAGYLEDMFAGVGTELLYRPFAQRWAVGANLWAVQQRGFDRLFDLQDYKTITGHISLYYETPWQDISLRVHAGRYLAGDYGATFEAVRVFDTGIQIGAWFTLTNVSAERFGEGSFDKGIIIRIPLEWVVPFGSRSLIDFDFRPIQRDGGQRLYGAQQLYDMTQPSSYGAMLRQWDSVFGR